jgi:hypothetical protein
MKKYIIISAFLVVLSFTSKAQIPNNGFENWTTVGGYQNPTSWNNCNSSSTNSFYPVTKSTDHYPTSIGSFSIRMENYTPLSNCSTYGFAQTSDNDNPCKPAFPITGHPNSLRGYYKCFPKNNDTIQIGLMLFKNGVWIAGAELLTTNTVSNWTPFNLPISSYTDADSATITFAAFFNDTTCGFPFGPFGNSVLYIDNVSFDNLITEVPEKNLDYNTLNIFPNPACEVLNVVFNENKIIDYRVKIYNIIGTLVKTETLKQNQSQINIEDLSNGTYLLEIESQFYIKKQKLIIQK